MMITSSMCPIQLFQTRFHCIADIRILILVEEHLKGNGDWNDFHANFTMDPDSQSPVSSSDTTLKNVWRSLWFWVILTGQICGSLSSWNRWINDRPLYQSLFWPLQNCFKFQTAFPNFSWVVCAFYTSLLVLMFSKHSYAWIYQPNITCVLKTIWM